MLLIMTITVLSLLEITSSFSRTTRDIGLVSEFQRIWDIEKKINDMSLAVHNYLESGGSDEYRQSYETSRSAVHKTLDELTSLNLDRKETALINSVTDDLDQMEKKAGRIFYLRSPAGRDKTLAVDLVTELDGLLVWMGHDIENIKKRTLTRWGRS